MVAMAFGYALTKGPLPWLLGLAAGGFVATAWMEASSPLLGICGPLTPAAIAGLATLPVQPWSPAAMMVSWLLMLATMMPPLLAQPVRHVWDCSFVGRRPRALVMFALGYGAVWIAAGVVLVPAAILSGAFVLTPSAGLALLALAFVWSSSPAAQRARNRCHRVRRVGAFGWTADRDCLAYGLANGVPCAVACWPWMIVPMIFGRLHMAAMAAVMLFLFFERLAPARRPGWRLPPALTTLRDLARRQKVAGSW